ncbi:efflux RND transporter permease subunit [Ruegeria sp. 2205SS24-7]|uniref:efflux RND transporter permease subunit n=1 Tax=Ruegeria discodermiae TaxID=3064389 RepID=UPI0027424FA5|nr:efflux RND transporter permease subunit [Ruegeria sp. 2205SS24-7]MDP5218847.1 efflux RND transporter permease subunit [Ruegeria sp. 2205SS24-7]
MASFFIRRPVFACVIAIVTMLAGIFGLNALPISQYPQIAPTTIQISAGYPGASAETVDHAVTSVIENSMTGLDGLTYMTSNSSEGSASISLTFDDSVDSEVAQVQVQNKLQLVQARLPASVVSEGVSVNRSTSSILMVGALVSEDGAYSSVELGNILNSTIENPVQRVEGVGSISSFGTQLAMRIWLNPKSLEQYQISPSDVTLAVSEQNTNVTVGSLGAQPVVKGQQITMSLSAQSQLSSVQDFEGILLKTNEDGSTVYLADVARVELSAESFGTSSRYNGKPAAGFGVNLAAGANAVKTAKAVRAEIDKLSNALPEGVTVEYPFDTSPFVEESITEVYRTLGEAVVLVSLVTLLFLQSWRATLIPTIAVPVVLLGTFGILAALGMSINTLTMFAMVLAIGLLVDDAIVVVENVERVMEEEGLNAFEATEKSMKEISGALVGIVVVLSAVFLPMAFMGGSTGVIYLQFSVTIISAMVLSLLVALILTPTMCVYLLKPSKGRQRIAPLRLFNAGLDRLTGGYCKLVGRLALRPFRMILLIIVIGYAAFWVFERLPSSFVPTEDQGVLMAIVQLPQDAPTAQTLEAVEAVEQYLLNEEADAVTSVFSALGFSFSGVSQNKAMMFIKLKGFTDQGSLDAASVSARANGTFFNNRMGQIYFLQPPAIQGLGSTSGFTMYLIDQAGRGTEALNEAANQLVLAAQSDERVTGVRSSDNAKNATLRLNIDQEKAEAFGLTLADINSMMTTIFAGNYVNDFTLGDDLREVIVQGDAQWRMQPSDIDAWSARNENNEMVPFSSFVTKAWTEVSPTLVRYGGSQALEISGAAAPGESSGAAMTAMEEMVGKLDGGFGVAWTGLSFQERLSGNQQPILFSLSALIVFLCLAALYESWTVPFAVMLSVPVGILGAILTTWYFGHSNDVYFKVGLLTIIGLASRNAILIVEFAQKLRAEGMEVIEATITAARQRLRPIIMTSFAFGFGITPLVLANGAGAEAQKSIGTGMLGGIIFSAILGILLVPVFYVAVLKAASLFRGRKEAKT